MMPEPFNGFHLCLCGPGDIKPVIDLPFLLDYTHTLMWGQ
jgi:hypothetical protein